MRETQLRQANELTTAKFFSEKYDLNIIYAIMGQIKESDSPTTIYEIRPSNISEHTGRRVRNDDFSKAVNRLLSTIFTITHDKGVLRTTFISSADFRNDGSVTVAIDSRLRPYLFELKRNFTIFGLHTAIALNSVYASRLYLMLCQFRSTGRMWLKVDELRERFCLNEGTSPKFALWSDFERKVLKVAQDEINEKADFQFDYELKREGKRVSSVDFKFRKSIEIKESKAPSVLDRGDDEKHTRLIERLGSFGLNDTQISQIFKKHEDSSVWKILYDYNLRKETITNATAYLLKALDVS